jgi:nitrite reductase (NADH) large subunit
VDEARSTQESLVIIGNGMASYKLCERLAALGGNIHYRIVVFGEEPRPAYDRVHLTDFLGGRSPEELTLAPRDWYAANGIELHTTERVVSIDRENRIVRSDAGTVASYDKVVFATGSRPLVPRIEGSELSNVFVYRTVEDLMAIRKQASLARSAAVIGGGLLGLEAARALQMLGVESHVVEYAPQLLPLQLDPASGELARRKIEDLGIHVLVNVRAERITVDGTRRLLHFAGHNRQPLAIDLIVIAAGVQPRCELARDCGLEVARGGVVVNDFLQTSDPNIFAIGECASHKGISYGLVAPAYRMAEVLAGLLTGLDRVFSGADLSTRLKVLGLDVAVLGDYNQPGSAVCWESNGSYRRIVLKRDRLVGASALGDWPEVQRMQDAIAKNRRLWPWQIARFRRHGRIWRPRTEGVENWAADATVCNCMSLSCGELRRACGSGVQTVEQLAKATGASTLCGSCKPLLAGLLGAAVPPEVSTGTRSLGVAALSALALIAAFVFLPAIPYSETVRHSVPYDLIWRDGVWKQATGFTLLALSVIGLLLSLRKRWPRFRFGEYGAWRVMHGAMGVAGLLVLVAHTGFRFGTNLNFALMSLFIAANFMGAVAGMATGLDRFSRPADMKLRRRLIWAHVLVTFPLPALVGFHILAVYYF